MSFLFIMLINSCSHQQQNEEVITGVKVYLDEANIKRIYDGDIKRLVEEIKKGGYNTLFSPGYIEYRTPYPNSITSSDSQLIKTKHFFELIKRNKLTFGLIVSVFHDPAASADESLIPVDQNMNREYKGWQKLVCPSNGNYRKYKLEYIKFIVDEIKPDILSLDFIRFPVEWELMTTEDIEIRNFCFCDRCIKYFESFLDYDKRVQLQSEKNKAEWIVHNAENEFTNWKSSLVTSFVKDFWYMLKENSGHTKLSLHIVPWNENNYKNGLMRIAGQDIAGLYNFADYFAPMTYHRMLKKDDKIIFTVCEEIKNKTGKEVLAGLEIDDSDSISIKERIAAKGYGRIDFHWGRVAAK